MILVDDGRDTGGERTKFKILNFLFKIANRLINVNLKFNITDGAKLWK